jgi:hypothetical protein
MPNADSFFLHEQSRVGSWAHDRAFCTSACMLRVVEAIKRELGLPNEIEGAVPIINAANAVMGTCIVPEEGSTLPAWAVFLSQNLRIHAVVS